MTLETSCAQYLTRNSFPFRKWEWSTMVCRAQNKGGLIWVPNLLFMLVTRLVKRACENETVSCYYWKPFVKNNNFIDHMQDLLILRPCIFGIMLALFPGSPTQKHKHHQVHGIFSHVIRRRPEFFWNKKATFCLLPTIHSTLDMHSLLNS